MELGHLVCYPGQQSAVFRLSSLQPQDTEAGNLTANSQLRKSLQQRGHGGCEAEREGLSSQAVQTKTTKVTAAQATHP